MDTDVEVVKPLDPYLQHEAFAGFESEKGVQTGLLACVPGFALFMDFLHHYDTAQFLLSDGTQDTTTNVEVLTRLCKARGLQMNDRYQVVDGLAVYPREYFCPVDYETEKLKRTRKTVTIHWFSGSWHTEEELEFLRQEKERLAYERRSNLRVRVGTMLLGEKGYEKLKALIKRQ